MANIGISKASYYADTSLVRFANEGVKSVDRLSSAQSDVVNGEVATFSGMNYTFKMDIAAAKASIKSLSTTQAYLTTAITALDNASHTLSQIQELAVLGANGSNSEADHAAFNSRAEELADQFHDVMSGARYKNEHIFDPKRLNAKVANGSGGSIDFGLAKIDYDFFYDYKNPEISILNEGIEYEITQDLTADQKAAILSRTTGLTEDQLVVGFRFTTDINPNDNEGNGSVSIIDGRPVGNAPYDTLEYTRGDNLVQFDPTAGVVSEEDFAGGSIEIEISENSEDADSLSIQTIGRISIDNISGIVSYNDPDDGWLEVGTIKEAQNGQNGKILRIDLFDDATKPNTGEITNGDFELPLRQQGLEPEPQKTYGVERDGIVVEGSIIITGGNGYVTAGDKRIIDRPRDSDTYNVNFTGGTGSGFRANLIVTEGTVTALEVLDRGENYSVDDVLTIDDNHFAQGQGFSIRIGAVETAVIRDTEAIVDQVPVIEFWDNPQNDTDINNVDLGDARYQWGEVYADGDVKKELVSEDDTVNPNVNGASLVNKLHITSGSYDNITINGNNIAWQTPGGVNNYSVNGVAFDGQYSRGDQVKLFNEVKLSNRYTAVNELHTTAGTYDELDWNVTWLDGNGNENFRTNEGVWDGSYALNDEKLEKLDNYVNGATVVYDAHTTDGTYDEQLWGVNWQNGDGEDNFRMQNGNFNGDYQVGDYQLQRVAPDNPNNLQNLTAVYHRNTNEFFNNRQGIYDWGETIVVGGVQKVGANQGDDGAYLTNIFHKTNGNYDWENSWSQNNNFKYAYADGSFFTGEYRIGEVELTRSENTGTAVYEVWTEAGVNGSGFDEWGRAVAVGDFKVTRTLIGTDIVDEVEVPQYRFDNIVSFYVNNNQRYVKDNLAFYTQRNEAFYVTEKEAFYVADDRVWVREATDGSTITRYLGEQDPQPNPNTNVTTGYTQQTEAYIQNWYVSELDDDGTPRVKFGQGDQAGSFTVLDTDNGNAIKSSTNLPLGPGEVRWDDTTDVKEISVPTPSWDIMKNFNDGSGAPSYEPNLENNWISDPTKEDQDHGSLSETSDNSSVSLVAGRTGNAIELDTGDIRFDDQNRFGIYHGPAIVSDEFDATEGQILRLEYTAQGQNDDYHVAGYVYKVNEVTGEWEPGEDGQPQFSIALMETGNSITNGRASVDIEESGKYRFVFIVGTHDLTGGKSAGANMTIDNIVVEWPAQIDNEVIEAILQSVHYENNSDTSTATKTLKATITNENGSTKFSDTALINMKEFTVTGEGGPFMMVPLDNLVTNPEAGVANGSANALTSKVELLQQKIDALRTQAGSKVSAIESAIDSATDLRSQFALASGTLSDINFSLETVHAAKRQIQQDVAAAMMAQANKSQDGMLSLVAEVEVGT